MKFRVVNIERNVSFKIWTALILRSKSKIHCHNIEIDFCDLSIFFLNISYLICYNYRAHQTGLKRQNCQSASATRKANDARLYASVLREAHNAAREVLRSRHDVCKAAPKAGTDAGNRGQHSRRCAMVILAQTRFLEMPFC